ncbi:A24 family peptidase [Microbacterium sp. SL62]|nr:A24 family peptidase [Microbacterium sp. SL62]
MLALATADIWRQEVEDWATVLLATAVLVAVSLEGISAQQWVAGALSAALAFAIYLALALRGAMGGGDVKLSVVPAFLLGAANPVLGLWWVCVSMLIQHGLFLGMRRWRVAAAGGGVVPVELPHVPAMTASLIASVMIFPI